ncbi:uracil-DNA glycosylase family protein [Haladaptatus sp. GCM10025707]|uniref:uracil-DNA glycosylase n=1 Tax=unclassified Haladaptatus TaxID=2622732 RepID=UPI0023E835FB|nr:MULTISPECIES: uracil-DNA glycosylase [unclassified Haladaptatus]
MAANPDNLKNPFNMDEACENCEKLCETRTNVVHGYGDVSAEFVFVGGQPSAGPDETGIPFTGNEGGKRLQQLLGRVGFSSSDPDAAEPDLENVFLTYTTRCRHPERGPTDAELMACDGYLTAELRMINPQIIVPVGQQALSALAFEYTTRDPDALDIDECHATTLRGRGFELIPLLDPADMDDDEYEQFVKHLSAEMGRDYRQTKGRRGR